MANDNFEIRHSLLIGNGINLVPYNKEGKTPLAWKDLFFSAFNDERFKRFKDNYLDIELTSYPLKYERMINYLYSQLRLKDTSKLETDIKQIIINELNNNSHPINIDIACELRKIPCSYILTTNYDTNLEHCIRGKKYEYSSTTQKNSEQNRAIFLKRTTNLKVKGKSPNEHQTVDFYHIHGIDSVPNSVCLGYLHYSEITSLLRKRLCGEAKNTPKPNIVSYLQNEGCAFLKKEYQTRFFDTDMAIIGLGLSDQEIDLWWILSYRAKLFFSKQYSIINTIIYYDVHKEKKTIEGYSYEKEYQSIQESIFNNMNIKYIPYLVEGNDYKGKYIMALKDIQEKFDGGLFIASESNNFMK